MSSLPPLTFWSLVTEARLDPVALTLVGGSAVGYLVGVRRLEARARPWPRSRSLAFASASLVMLIATCSGLAAYDTVQFSVHVVQHVLLGLVAPVLLVLAAPITLLVQASARHTQVQVLGVLSSRPMRVLSQPVVTLGLFATTLWLLYFSPLYGLTVTNDVVHGWMHLHFVVVGVLFFGAVLATDPRPHVPPAWARAAMAFIAVPLHAFVGIALLTSTTILGAEAHAGPRAAWQGGALADQRLGAGLLLSLGEVVGVTVLLLAMRRWMAEDERSAARVDRASRATSSAASPFTVGAGS